MKVFLLPIAEDRCIFYSEPPRRDGKARGATFSRGPEGPPPWLRRQFQKAQNRLLHSRRHAGPTLRKILDFFDRLHSPDESMLHRLRKMDRIEILYPAAMSELEAVARWMEYTRQCYRRHFWRTILNLLICPLTVALTPVPGPNLVGYWFVYRAASHGLALWGTRRVRKGHVAVAFYHCPALDDLIEAESARPLQDENGRATLRRFVVRTRKKLALAGDGSTWRMES